MNENLIYQKHIKEKYKNEGMENMTETEILSLLLSYTSVKDCRSASEKLLSDFGSIGAVFSSDIHYILAENTLDFSGAVILKMISELSRIYSLNSEKIKYLRTVSDAKRCFDCLLKGVRDETLYIISVDENMKIKDKFSVSSDVPNSVNADIRVITDNAVKKRAYGIFIAHRHPLGSAEPSSADIALTEKIIDAMRLYGIKVFDHIISGVSSSVSMKYDGFSQNFDEIPLE